MFEALRHPDTKKFFDYWNSMPKSGLMPDRRMFDPLVICSIMPRVIMVEYFPNGEVVFRLVGTSVTNDIGLDPTGKSYFSLLDDDALGAFWMASEPMLSTPCGGYFQVSVRARSGYLVDIDLLDLPMTNKAAGSKIIFAHAARGRVMDIIPEGDFQIAGIRSSDWVDIGAGVPTGSILEG